MGIAIHSLATAEDHADTSTLDLAAALRQDASGLLGTTVQYADLTCGVGPAVRTDSGPGWSPGKETTSVRCRLCAGR